jgi:hypothetical protein
VYTGHVPKHGWRSSRTAETREPDALSRAVALIPSAVESLGRSLDDV